MKRWGIVVGLIVLLGMAGTADAAFTPREWLKGGINVVAGVVVGVDDVAEGVWDVLHGKVIHPLGIWGKAVMDGIVSIGEQPSS